mmetsp:Transcript_24217/g.49696  ORF Transcript_24217/g.49696 Transcript_24217/m.49696 type:complete len:203 (+) Transcript_24217:208-816(+)
MMTSRISSKISSRCFLYKGMTLLDSSALCLAAAAATLASTPRRRAASCFSRKDPISCGCCPTLVCSAFSTASCLASQALIFSRSSWRLRFSSAAFLKNSSFTALSFSSECSLALHCCLSPVTEASLAATRSLQATTSADAVARFHFAASSFLHSEAFSRRRTARRSAARCRTAPSSTSCFPASSACLHSSATSPLTASTASR